MMYIEHTPLEDNLKYIVKNHVPASNANSILANVSDSTESTDLRQRAHLEDARAANGGTIHTPQVNSGIHTATNGEHQEAFSTKQDLERVQCALEPPTTNGVDNYDEDCDYELVDIIDDAQPEQSTQSSENQNVEEANIIGHTDNNKDSTEPENTSSFNIIIESGEDSYVLKLPPEEIQYETEQQRKEPQKLVKRAPPPIIPIKDLQAGHPLFSRFIQEPQKRILNGKLPVIFLNKEGGSQEHFLPDIEFDSTTATANGFEETVEDEEEKSFDQMGITLLNKLRDFLFNRSNTTKTSRESEKRKRSGDWTSDVNPHPMKYRKVRNHFPKVITHVLDDDFDMTSNARRDKPFSYMPTEASANPVVMSQHRENCRKSIFQPPLFTNKLVRNSSYADEEFSDDDEPEFIQSYETGAVGGGIPRSKKQTNKIHQVINVPILREEHRIPPAEKRPPPLIETRSILANSLRPEIDLTKRKPLSYEEVFQQNTQLLLGGRRPASSISSSGASTSASMGGINMMNNARPLLWPTNVRSILTQEKETEEHERYQALLKQVVPGIYGTTGVNNCFQMPTKPINLESTRRRSALLNITGNNGSNKPCMHSVGKTTSPNKWQQSLKRPPLSSTINLDDDDENHDDVIFTDVVQLKQRPRRNTIQTIVIDGDEISEIIDLDEEERKVVSACSKVVQNYSPGLKEKTNDTRLPYVQPVNTLEECFKTSPHLKDNWLEAFHTKWNEKKKTRQQEVGETVNAVQKLTAERRAAESEMFERLRKIKIVDPDLLVIDDFPEPEEDVLDFFELTAEQQARIKEAVCGPPDQVLISKFNLNITRRDIHTLLGHNWLNDEVINFYMNLLTERGDLKHESHGLPTVYAMNTFFIPRLLSAGHGGVKRWTRKVDIFSKDVIPVPVHVGGVHWCMAIIHLKNRTIKYYDSMGTPNPTVLKALEQYLKDESMDKRRQPFDVSQFHIESVQDVPRQMNGSDCGVFSCMFAEFITRNREITFSQQHMEYFRHKMILEIVQGRLLQ